MITLFVFLGAAALVLAVGVLRRQPVKLAGALALRLGLAVMFVFTGASHFLWLRSDLIAMVPPVLPAPGLLVTVTGVLEIAGAVGLLLPATAAWAAGGLALLLVAMFPANVYAALSGVMLNGQPATALVPRTAMQVFYVVAAVAVVVGHRRRAIRPSTVREVTAALPRVMGPAAEEPAGVVLISRLELRSLRQVPAFLRAALQLRRALRKAPGAISLDVAAQPLTKTFWTWSIWTDETAMNIYVRSPLHVEVMHSYRGNLASSAFQAVGPVEAPHSWPDVRARLAAGQAALPSNAGPAQP
jgi:uncharacterized membrane protein/quinol monooxygenase YgiN